MSLVLRSEKGSRLSIFEMDGNFTYLQSISGGSVVTISATTSVYLQQNGLIQSNKSYCITGVDTGLYGGTDILVIGLTSSQFSSNGWGKFYNPLYNSFPMWDRDNTFNTNDPVIYGGQVWLNTGSYSNADDVDVFNLNGNWSVQSYTNSTYYVEKWDEIEYDFENDYINARYDAENNNLVKVDLMSSLWFYCEVTPIKMFRWGHRLFDGGVAGCSIENSYFGCLNYISGSILGVKLNNYSYIFNLNLANSSTFGPVELTNNSTINNIYLYDVNMQYITMENNSEMTGLYVTGSTIQYINLNKSDFDNITSIDGTIKNIEVDNSSVVSLNVNGVISNINVYNDSSITTIFIDGESTIDGLTIENNSVLSGIGLISSYIENSNISNSSSIENLNLTNSYIIYSSILNDSTMQNATLLNSNYANIELKDSYFGGNNIDSYGNISNIQINDGGFYNNTISGGGMYDINLQAGQITSNTFTQSSLWCSDMLASGFYGNSISNANMEFIYMKDANISYINNDINIIQLNMVGSTLNFNSNPYTLPNYTNFNTNTLKYQFQFNFTGDDGYGATTSPLNYFNTLLVPNGFYIERITLDTVSIVTNGDLASISIGISGLTNSGINQTLYSDVVKVYDISNGLSLSGKAQSDTTLSANVTDFSVVSGTMYVEMIIKNTNYGTNND